MASGKRKSGKKGSRKARRSSSLTAHKRHKKVLTPPLMALGDFESASWQHDGLPDFIWLQAIRDETRDLSLTNDALDVLDEFVPQPPEKPSKEGGTTADERRMLEPHPNEFLDGRVSNLVLVPEDRRADARAALRDRAPWALPDVLGHALALYPECPAAWLYDDWAKVNHADPEIGTGYLKRLVASILDPRGRPSSQLRTIPTSRMFKHDKLFLAEGLEVVELIPRYPGGLEEEDQLHVEQWARNVCNIHLSMSDRTVADNWTRYFWRQNWRISACEPEPSDAPPPEEDEAEDEIPSEEGRGHRQISVAEIRGTFVQAIGKLGDELREHQNRLAIDTYEPTSDEVKLGLASRVFRLLHRLAGDPELWTNELGPHVLRSMVDARIVISWLLQQDDAELYARFKEYGLGKRKLFKLKLEELMDRDDPSADAEDHQPLHRGLEAEVNEDVMEEFVKIDLGGSFSGKNIRDMAKDAGLDKLYSLQYQPLSTEAHGEWGSLIALDLRRCGNPLHRYHRLGTFSTSPLSLVHLGWVNSAFSVAQDAITDIFASYDMSVQPLFEECLRQMAEAISAGTQKPVDPRQI